MIIVAVAVVAAIFIGSYFKKKTDASASGGNMDPVLSHLANVDNGYKTPVLEIPTRQYGPTIEQLGVKPKLVVTQHSPTTGNIQWMSQYANNVRGIAVDGTVLFDVSASDNHAVYAAARILDRLLVHGLGGDVVVQIDFMDTMANSGSSDLVSRPSIVTNINTGNLPWPANDSIPVEI